MPRAKQFKQMIRERQKKTGESYSIARMHVGRMLKNAPPCPDDGPDIVSARDALKKQLVDLDVLMDDGLNGSYPQYRMASEAESRVKMRLARLWAKPLGLKNDRRWGCVRNLLNARHSCARSGHMCLHLPGDDHRSCWSQDGVPAVYVTQPYPEAWNHAVAAATRFCAEYGLRLTAIAPDDPASPAWHCPGSVVFVTVVKDEDSPRHAIGPRVEQVVTDVIGVADEDHARRHERPGRLSRYLETITTDDLERLHRLAGIGQGGLKMRWPEEVLSLGREGALRYLNLWTPFKLARFLRKAMALVAKGHIDLCEPFQKWVA